MRKLKCLVWGIFLLACSQTTDLMEAGEHYQQHGDYASLQRVVDELEPGADTSTVRKILGAPIDMGFDYRYTLDSVGPNGCVVGAVFHINEAGKIDQQWLDEICE